MQQRVMIILTLITDPPYKTNAIKNNPCKKYNNLSYYIYDTFYFIRLGYEIGYLFFSCNRRF